MTARPTPVLVCLTLAAVLVGACGSNQPTVRGGTKDRPTRDTGSRGSGRDMNLLDDEGVHLDNAEDAIRRRDYERALREFERAIQVNPTLTEAYMGAADIYRVQGDYASAERNYSQAARLEPENFDAQYYHGLMLHLLDRVTDAIRAYLRALALRPDDFQTNLNLATAYYQLEECSQALPYATESVRLDPQSGPARVNLGAVYACLDRHQEAVSEYQQAAELMPLNPKLLLSLAESLGKTSRYDEMRNTLEQLVRMQPTASAFERLGYAQFKLGSYAQALDSFNKSLEQDASYFPALNGVGVCELNNYVWSGKSDESAKTRAVDALRRSLRLNPDQPRITELLSRYR